MAETKYFETENGVAIGGSVLIKDDSGSAIFYDANVPSGVPLSSLNNAVKRRAFLTVHRLNTANLSTVDFLYRESTTALSGSASGYFSCYPFVVPFACAIEKIKLTVRGCSYEDRASAGPLYLNFGIYTHTYNSNARAAKILATLPGSYTGYQILNGTYQWETSTFSVQTGSNSFAAGSMIGVEWSSESPVEGQIYLLQRPIMQLELKEL